MNFLAAINEFRKNAPDIAIRGICLDSANDNYGTYELLQKWKIRPFIDLNPHHGFPGGIPEHVNADADGTPVCKAGHRMVYWGYDRSRHAVKWRCPLVMKKISHCDCACSANHLPMFFRLFLNPHKTRLHIGHPN